ncbi:hypothetical protein EON80_11345 [bacterium]|nr:MAG: hypothetical protein EON80_11345 [bacterium]
MAPINDDAPNTGYALLGFFIPIVGLILYFVEKSRKPMKAMSALKGAATGFILSFVGMFLVIVLLSILGNRVRNPSYRPPNPNQISPASP